MKVLVCIPCLLTGGTEIQTLSLVEVLAAAGHSVIVACYFEYSQSMVERFEHAGAMVRLLSPEGNRPSGVLQTTQFLWHGLRKIVREFRPDVAHVQYMAPGALPVIILKALGVKHVIATSHTSGDIYSRNGLRLIRFLTRTCLSGFQCITLRAEESYFGSSSLFDGTKSTHFTIYNSLPSHIKILTSPRPSKSEKEPLVIGVVSRLERIKGMDLVIPAFAKVCESAGNVRLLIVGDGSLKASMQEQANSLDVAEKVTFLGRQPQSALNSVYDSIDILLMPSRSEGFGLTALEGMARGCVPVVANTGGLPEVVLPGTGLLHKPEEIDSMVESIISLVNDYSCMFRMSEAAMVRASNLSGANFQKTIVQLYSTLK